MQEPGRHDIARPVLAALARGAATVADCRSSPEATTAAPARETVVRWALVHMEKARLVEKTADRPARYRLPGRRARMRAEGPERIDHGVLMRQAGHAGWFRRNAGGGGRDAA